MMTRQIKADPSVCRESAASSSPPAQHREDVASASPKRPAGRTKFRETRHPVFRGVRRRGLAGGRCRWVRVPGRRGHRLWLGTFAAAEGAARAHDAAMLALHGAGAAARRLIFPDSAWLLDVPVPPRADVRRAVALAVEGFLRARPAAEDAMSATSGPSSAVANDDGAATETEASSSFFSSSPSGSDDAREASPFELDMLSDMGAALYYANLAQGLLMEPPPLGAPCADDSDCDLAAVALWPY